ncbi:DUF6544 family protein [Chitinophaga ginsengisoli]|uniref:Uncharacterized protein n=1 Tax=Chitinophaga ginsengisoli TaxID=363837 RepID=A0A2P8GL22_9BACT|nr:DUF6544 family protein [Chitinophaga ginsengisoli]PSL34677.1 hypothetical protein CLV42_102250 [Chitinophaga ginsengisoli]
MLSGWIWLSVAIIIAFIFRYRHACFYGRLETDYEKLFTQCNSRRPDILITDDIRHLPPVVVLWLTRSGVLNKAFNGAVHLYQQGAMRTGDNSKWMPVKAEQWFSSAVPGFLWTADVKMFPALHLAGKDSYINGKGHMLISLLSVLPIVNATGPEIDQGSMIRYLAEIVWFPYAAVSHYIKWEEVDDLTARATITYGGNSASALFHFNEEGDFVSLKAKRYYSAKGKTTLEDWLVETEPGAYQTFEGTRIPNRLQVTWLLKSGRFTWFRLKVTDIKYHENRKYQLTQHTRHEYLSNK